MKQLSVIILLFLSILSFAQEDENQKLLSENKANDYVYQGNELLNEDKFVAAEMEYRKAISTQPDNIAGTYNLGHSYYRQGNFTEALYRHQQAAKKATSKEAKHKAFHNIGNILMKNKQCKEAVEAYKNALRNNPKDDETRYNLAIAKACAEQQKDQDQDDKDKDKNEDQNKDQDQDKDKDNEEDKDKEGDDKEDKQDKGDEDKKDGDDEKDDKGKPKDEKEDKGEGDESDKKEQQQPKPQQGQMSPEQIKSLLEAMNNQEQKVQEKINAEKQKGVRIKTEKDW